MRARHAALLGALIAILATGGASAQQHPTQTELNASARSTEWPQVHHDYAARRFVDLKILNRNNVARLRPVCSYDTGGYGAFYTNPVVYRGVLYLTHGLVTVALDAATCEELWRHEWWLQGKFVWPQNRGVALKDGRLVRGTTDGYLFALDAASGKELWQRAVADSHGGETLTMAPTIFEDLVIIGPAGSENAIKGWVGAFRLADGSPVWRFNTVPRPGELGAETWRTTPGREVGGGGIWTSIAVDVEAGRVYVPVTNPAPDFFGAVRHGDNLYTNTMVVLDARTGALLWYDQAVPHDVHDYDLTQANPLFSTTVDGTTRKLVASVGKDGLLRVLDRDSREQIYDVAVTTRKNADWPVTVEGVHACPGVLGGVQWNGPAYNPGLDMLYVPSVDWCGTFHRAKELVHIPGRLYMGGHWEGDEVRRGWITAIDAATGSVRWQYHADQPMLAAIATTAAGLLFTGELSGDVLALDARDGTELFRHDLGDTAVAGGVITYAAGGKQYLAVTSGSTTFFWGTPETTGKLTVFGLP